MESYTTRRTCRVCGHGNLKELFSLGNHYVNDFPVEPNFKGIQCPIDLVLCLKCSLVQQLHTAPSDFMYTRHYWYRSGVTETMRRELRGITAAAEAFVDLKPDDVVLDIGSNDGTLLRSYSVPCIKVGVEPAINLMEEGSKGIDQFVSAFWDVGVYASVRPDGPKAKVVTAIGMFYDLEKPNEFVAGIKEALHEDGIFIAQLMCLAQTINNCDVGNFCHEHLEFYSLRSLEFLLSRQGLRIFDIEQNSVNGGSYRLYCCHGNSKRTPSEGARQRIATFMDLERDFQRPEVYEQFYQRIMASKIKVRQFIHTETSYGKKVWAFGASTKGNTLLQFYGLDERHISGASDRSPEKHGRYMVGTGIKIYSEEDARAANPDYFLVLPYAFIKEFVSREKDWLESGGKFIVPLPSFRIVSAADDSSKAFATA